MLSSEIQSALKLVMRESEARKRAFDTVDYAGSRGSASGWDTHLDGDSGFAPSPSPSQVYDQAREYCSHGYDRSGIDYARGHDWAGMMHRKGYSWAGLSKCVASWSCVDDCLPEEKHYETDKHQWLDPNAVLEAAVKAGDRIPKPLADVDVLPEAIEQRHPEWNWNPIFCSGGIRIKIDFGSLCGKGGDSGGIYPASNAHVSSVAITEPFSGGRRHCDGKRTSGFPKSYVALA